MKKNKFILIFLVLMLLFFIADHYFDIIGRNIGKTQIGNRVLALNTSYGGISIFYDTMEEMGYNVRIDSQNFLEGNNRGIFIITETKNPTDFNLNKAEAWIKSGGQLIYLTDNYHLHSYPDLIRKYKEEAYLYTLGNGKILIGDIRLVTNETLLEDREGAYFILSVIDELDGNIYFNEYFRFSQGYSPSLYRDLPLAIKILLFQILLFLIGCIIYFGARFGKAKRISEEIERDENEYLKAASNLYEKGQCIDVIYDVFYKEFHKEFNRTFKIHRYNGNWLDLWQEKNLPNNEKAVKVFNYIEKGSGGGKERLSIIKDMDELTEVLIARRGMTWRKLRQKS